jgi:hypothetical membrane protein
MAEADDHVAAPPMRSLGPLVPRIVHLGAILIVVASLVFIGGMVATQLAYAHYSLTQNYISDLGNSTLSPDAWVYNLSIRVTGVLTVLGVIAIRGAFPPKTLARLGLFFLALTGVGAFLVGSFPEGSPQLGGAIHSDLSALTFVSSALGLLFISGGMLRDTRWDGYRAYTAFSGLVTFAALAVFVAGHYPLLGPGGWERLVVAPILLWAIVAGVHLFRIPTYAPRVEKLVAP